MVLLLIEIKATQWHDPMFAQPKGDATGVKSRTVLYEVAKRKGNKHLLDTFLF